MFCISWIGDFIAAALIIQPAKWCVAACLSVFSFFFVSLKRITLESHRYRPFHHLSCYKFQAAREEIPFVFGHKNAIDLVSVLAQHVLGEDAQYESPTHHSLRHSALYYHLLIPLCCWCLWHLQLVLELNGGSLCWTRGSQGFIFCFDMRHKVPEPLCDRVCSCGWCR